MLDAARRTFWRRVQWLTGGLLAVWLLLNLALPWFARDLASLYSHDFPVPYWLAAEGALGAYLVLILVYVLAMERLESQFFDDDGKEQEEPAADADAEAGRG